MAGEIGLEALQAPAWLGDAGLARCRRALTGKLARETWKYSPLGKVTQALLDAPMARCSPLVDAPEQVRVRRFTALPSPPECRINLHRYPLAGIVAALAGDGWLAEVAETPDRPLRLPAATPGVAAPLLLRVAAGCRVEIEEADAGVSTIADFSGPQRLGDAVHQATGGRRSNKASGNGPEALAARTPEAESGGIAAAHGNRGALATRVVLLFLAQAAEVRWSRADLAPAREGWSLLAAELDEDASLTFNHQSLAAAFQRLDVSVALHGAGARFGSTGAALASAGAQLDLQYVIEHIGHRTVSRVKQHNLASGKARCTFNGRIHIHPHASGADADLSNRNLALSANADINTKPELEIYNDDVRCAHGATVGRLDDDALFYLQSRGLTTAAAQRLLSIGFLRDGLSGPFAEQAANSFIQQLSAATGG